MIYAELSFNDFEREFSEHGREDNFSYHGLKALYDYVWDSAEDVGTPYVLDVVALCCTYTEYSLEDAVSAFPDLLEGLDTTDEILDVLNDHTTAIRTGSSDIIVVADF